MLWLVIHYTGADGSARDNGRYFAGGNRNASAHYFIDDVDIVLSVSEEDTAWAVGNFAANQRSISIEVCSAGEDFSEAEIGRLAWLVGDLMARYGIPAERVVRHRDMYRVATAAGIGGGWVDPGKACPAPYVDDAKWAALHARITSGAAAGPREEEDDMRCIIRPDGADCLVYFDGHDVHDVPHPDCIEALNRVHRATHGGADMPTVELGTPEAPYFARLMQVLHSGEPTADLVPTLDAFPPRSPEE